MHADQQSIMDSLRDKGPEAFREYLRRFEEGAPLSGSGLSMLVVFHYAAPLAEKQESIDWAEVAVRAAELEARNSTGVERENSLLWAMNLRSRFICKMGSRSDHFVLDKAVILAWVMECLTLPVQTALAKSAAVKQKLAGLKVLSNPEEKQRIADDLSELFRIKHRLNIAKVLVDCGELRSDPVLNEWLEIREQLP